MEKKKFSQTSVGKFLLNKIPSVVGAIAGDTPVGSVIQAIIGGSDMSDSDKKIALEKLKNERAEIDGTTKRWIADSRSSFLAQNIRPLTLLSLTGAMIFGYFMQIPNLELLTDMGKIVFLGYFGGRSSEKIFGNKMHK
jgi:hypothetical protein